MKSRHVVVVGGGVFGATASLELRRRGWAVTLLDSGPLPHRRASSTDVSKLVRMDYGGDIFYHELAEAALEGWDRWNRDWPRPLYHEHGLLVLTPAPMTPGGFEYESWRTLLERGYRPERLDRDRIEARFPAWRTSEYSDGYLSGRGGWAESAAVVERLLELGAAAGVRLRLGVMRAPAAAGSSVDGVLLDDGDRLDADCVVVCAGAWTPTLLPWLADRMRSVGQPVVYLTPEDPEAFRAPRFPPWAADIANTGWYGFPALSDGRVKIGHHGTGIRVGPDERGDVGTDHVARVRAFLGGAIPSLASAPLVGRRICLYCDTFDGDFLVDHDPDREGLVVACGGSGHGFKFAPLLGAVIADVIEGRPNHWAERFRWRAPGPARTEEARFTGA